MFKFWNNYFEIRIAAVLISIIAGLYLLNLVWGVIAGFSDIILVIIVAWFLAFILEPFVENLCKRGLSRAVSALLVYFVLSVAVLFLIYLILPLTVFQISSISSNLPGILGELPFGTDRFQEFINSALSNSLPILSNLASFLFYLFIVIILSFYFLVDRRKITSSVLRLIPEGLQNEAIFLNQVLSTSVAGYVRVQIIYGIITAFYTAILLMVLGVKFTLSAAFLAGVFTVIPALGPILAIFPPVLAALFDGPQKAIAVGVLSFIFQQIQFNIIGPKLTSNVLKLSPIVVILSFIIGFKVAGAWGAIFSMPVASVITVIGGELISHWVLEKENVARRVREATSKGV